jgi:hypothetical protein
MPRGRSSFAKRLKEQARQQKQREKAERRNQRRQERSQMPAEDLNNLSTPTESDGTLFRAEPDLSNLTEPQPGRRDTPE